MQTQFAAVAEATGSSHLALLGGEKAVQSHAGNLFTWPIITAEDEDAALAVLRRGAMSGTDVTRKFEAEYAAWQGAEFAIGFNTGTAAIHSAMYGCGVGVGDEIICPSLTYWASALQCFSLGASVVFADVDPVTLCLDPSDIEHRITPRTKAIIVVHFVGYPADMDEIMTIARRHGVKVIEDVSHAHGTLYKGRKAGTLGDVGAMSIMTAKSLAVGEAGMLVTNNREIYERATVFGHYERADEITSPDLVPYVGLPFGGQKYRMHQISSAVGRVQLRYYDERIVEIDEAMNYFWELLDGVPGLRKHAVPSNSGSTMGGWYSPLGRYVPEELGGLSVTRFADAVMAEGATCYPGCYAPLHLHPLLNDCDIYGHGHPTRNANSPVDLRQPAGSMPVSESINSRIFRTPWFKHLQPELIQEHARAYTKVVENYASLLEGDSAAEVTGQTGLSGAAKGNGK